MPRILVLGTADTKAQELAYLATLLRAGSLPVVTADVGTCAAAMPCDITAETIAAHDPDGAAAVLGLSDRGRAVAAMATALAHFLPRQSDLAGVIGIGGGGGTAIITAGMRELPYGLPKIMVSTLASGQTAPYIGISDLILMPSVTDLAGLNTLSRTILHNAARALLGMTASPAPRQTGLPAIGLTMFGVTTPCVTAITAALPDRDCLTFHATGTGGRTMEKLAESGLLTAFIDITTTEVADLLCGGTLACTEDRFGAAARTRLPWIGSQGALDMVNFGAPETVPPHLKARLFYHHNPQVTLMRTTPAENTRIGHWIATKLNQCHGPVKLLIPERGISALDIAGGPFHDPEANAALFTALETTLTHKITRLPLHINDPAFAAACVRAYREIQ